MAIPEECLDKVEFGSDGWGLGQTSAGAAANKGGHRTKGTTDGRMGGMPRHADNIGPDKLERRERRH